MALAELLGEPLVTVDDKLRRRLAPLGLALRPDEALSGEGFGGERLGGGGTVAPDG